MNSKKNPYNPKSGFKIPENYLKDFSVELDMANLDADKKSLDSKKSTGFSVPDNYFEDFKVKAFTEEETSSILPQKSASGFTAPKNYLEDFNVSVATEVKKKPKVISLFTAKNAVKTAAAIAAIFILGIFLVPEKSISENSVFQVSQLEIESYLEEQNIDFKSQDLNYSFDDNQEEINNGLNEIAEDAIFEYLNENSEVSMLLNK